MRRIRTITLDNLQFKMAPFTYDETDEYLRENRELATKEPPQTDEEKAARVLDTVIRGLNFAVNGDGAQWDRKRLTGELDSQTIMDLHAEFLRICGLTVKRPGEAEAAPKSISN